MTVVLGLYTSDCSRSSAITSSGPTVFCGNKLLYKLLPAATDASPRNGRTSPVNVGASSALAVRRGGLRGINAVVANVGVSQDAGRDDDGSRIGGSRQLDVAVLALCCTLYLDRLATHILGIRLLLRLLALLDQGLLVLAFLLLGGTYLVYL